MALCDCVCGLLDMCGLLDICLCKAYKSIEYCLVTNSSEHSNCIKPRGPY